MKEVILNLEVDKDGFKLEDKSFPEKKLYDDKETEAEFPEVQLMKDKEGYIRYVDFEFIGLNDKEVLRAFESYVKKLSPKGLYTVPELNLKNVPFYKVIKTLKGKLMQNVNR